MNINEKILSIIGCIVSSLSLILGVVAFFNDRLLGGMILAGISLLIFLIIAVIFIKRHPLKFTILPFQEISCENFYNKLDYDTISAINIIAHTGANLIDPLFSHFEESEEKKNKLKQISIRILLRNPKAEIDRRTIRINQTVERIREYQRKGFNQLLLQFYEGLPTFRAIICHGKHPQNQNKIAFLSFYYFPTINSPSRKYPCTLVVEENQNRTYHQVAIYESWFNYYWGKNRTEEQQIHTLILDFDDTIVNSHDIQIEAWVELVGEAQKKYQLTPANFNKNIRRILDNKNELRRQLKTIFFLKQDARLIFPELFSPLDPDLTDELHQLRFEIREKKVREERNRIQLFPYFMEAIVQLSLKYNLIIVSATDEKMIMDYLSAQRLPANTPEGKDNLYELFRYVFGKREATFDWKNMKRKSQLIIKIINLLGIPIERMVYVGDNHSDFVASTDIGIQFVEARLFQQELSDTIEKDSLISAEKEPLYFTDWSDFKKILEKIERTARA